MRRLRHIQISRPLKPFKTLLSHVYSKVEAVPHDVFPILVIAPVVIFYLIDPEFFQIEWVGYATFAFATFFVVITWLIYRTTEKPSNKINLKGAMLSIATIFLYQFVAYALGYSEAIIHVGESLGIQEYGLRHWGVAIDITFFALYLTGLTISFLGVKSLRKLSAPICYSFLTVFVILIDTFFRFASFTAFQIFVPYILISVRTLLPLFGVRARSYFLHDAKGQIRAFLLVTEPRFLALEVNWPCAGISSMIIYFGLMFGLLQIWDITKKRKAIYLAVGFVGTVLANIFRIVTLILLYTYFEANIFIFHEYMGALFFVSWITVFAFVVFMIEKKRRISEVNLVKELKPSQNIRKAQQV